MQCPQCESEIDQGVSYCPSCGLDIDALREELGVDGSDDESLESRSDPPEATSEESSGGAATNASAAGADAAEEASPESTASGSESSFSSSTLSESDDDAPSTRPAGSGTSNRATGGAASESADGEMDALSFTVLSREYDLFSLGFLVGAAAFVGNYLMVYLLYALEASDSGSGPAGGAGEPEVVGYLLYSAHTVDIEFTSPTGTFQGRETEAVNLLQRLYTESNASLSVPEVVYYIVPILGLALAGRWVADQLPSTVQSQKYRGMAGALVMAGYSTLAIALAMTVFQVSGENLTTAPSLGQTITLMGVAYPVVVGGLAGYLSN